MGILAYCIFHFIRLDFIVFFTWYIYAAELFAFSLELSRTKAELNCLIWFQVFFFFVFVALGGVVGVAALRHDLHAHFCKASGHPKNDSIFRFDGPSGMGLGNFVDIKLRFIFQYLLLSNIETKPNWTELKVEVEMEMALQMGAGGMQKDISESGTGPGVFQHATWTWSTYVRMYMHNRSSHIELYDRPIRQWFHGTRYASPTPKPHDPPFSPGLCPLDSVRFAVLERKPPNNTFKVQSNMFWLKRKSHKVSTQ